MKVHIMLGMNKLPVAKRLQILSMLCEGSKRTPTLSPAYDLLTTIPCITDETMALNYSRTKKMTVFSKDELTHLAAKAKISESWSSIPQLKLSRGLSSFGRKRRQNSRSQRRLSM
jgi:hypothetical protein